VEALVDHPSFGKIWIRNATVIDGRIKGTPRRLLIPAPGDSFPVVELSANRIVRIHNDRPTGIES
jgi:hypothetical protein